MPSEARSPVLQRVILIAVILAFGVYTAVAIVEHGVAGFMEETVENMATGQVLIDLTIALTLVVIWMRRDSRTSGMPFTPYLLLTLFAGSFGPLTYLLHRTWKRPVPAVQAGAV
jgi:hypothetical protein